MPMFYEFSLAHLLCRLKVGKLRILVNQYMSVIWKLDGSVEFESTNSLGQSDIDC